MQRHLQTSTMAEPFLGVGRKFETEFNEPPGNIYEVIDQVEGKAIFALIEEFPFNISGHLAFYAKDGSLRQFQINGQEEVCSNDCLCADDGYSHCRLIFKDRQHNSQAICRAQKSGNNFLHLSPRDASRLSFQPDNILTEEEDHNEYCSIVSKFFPKTYAAAHSRHTDLVLNLGTLRIQQLRFFSSHE